MGYQSDSEYSSIRVTTGHPTAAVMDQQEPLPKKRKLSSRDEPQGPSCSLCRRRKAKCSRDQPCTTCIKLDVDCIFDQDKSKPGMPSGAIERLTQRVATLENMFVGQGILWQQMWNSMKQQNGQDNMRTPESHPTTSIQQQASDLKQFLSEISSSNTNELAGQAERSNQLQANVAENSSAHALTDAVDLSYQDVPNTLPPDDLVHSLVDVYFQDIHPWIPMLHERTFRACLSDPSHRPRVLTILHAIVSLCIRFSNDQRLLDAPHLRSQYATRCRQTVILAGMEAFSVENLQALIICAFDIIGSGRGPSAWSIVGSMTRTVEQLRLSIEEDEELAHQSTSQALIKRMAFLPPAVTWTETEERRRIFWNVFLMDRFCSISTGWNLSLTSADVKRRLPCEGAIWESGEPSETPTPYFGISTRSHDPEKDYLAAAREAEDDQTDLGGFAFCVEATESLSLVTSFFLQYEIDFKKVQQVQRWLMRFKQLDLRLVQWKVFLPEQWREACHINRDGNLDPNLVLAHMMHNTAVVLLHQGLAYPSAEWQSLSVSLPSASSADTCQAAAVEVAAIAEQFLRYSTILISPQFSFCLFVCGKMLLTHAAYYQSALHSSFDSIVRSLEEISLRWNGKHPPVNTNLASKFSSRLKKARLDGVSAVDIREPFSERLSNSEPSGVIGANQGGIGLQTPSTSTNAALTLRAGEDISLENIQTESPDSISLAFPPLPLSFQNSSTFQNPTLAMPAESHQNPEETIASDMDISGSCLDLYDLSDEMFYPSQRVSILSRSYLGT